MITSTQLETLEVINVADGRRLGLVADMDVDVTAGRIAALIVPGSGGFLGMFGGRGDLTIRWDHIVQVGEDVILVDMPAYQSPRDDRRQEAGS